MNIVVLMVEHDDFTRRNQPNPADKGKTPYDDNKFRTTKAFIKL